MVVTAVVASTVGLVIELSPYHTLTNGMRRWLATVQRGAVFAAAILCSAVLLGLSLSMEKRVASLMIGSGLAAFPDGGIAVTMDSSTFSAMPGGAGASVIIGILLQVVFLIQTRKRAFAPTFCGLLGLPASELPPSTTALYESVGGGSVN